VTTMRRLAAPRAEDTKSDQGRVSTAA
jgi:hypothetical protein